MQRRRLSHPWLLLGVIVSLLLMVPLSASLVYLLLSGADDAPVTDTDRGSRATNTPRLTVDIVARGLDHPWDVGFLPDSTMLVTERSGAISKLINGGKTTLLSPADVVARGEGGMMGLAIDPQFRTNRQIYTCFNSSRDGLDVRVVRWKVNENITSLEDRRDIVTGIPSATSGRHSGCRLSFDGEGNLWIGTGDTADSREPQNLKTLGGKILRVDSGGRPVQGNLASPADPRIFSYGHRNLQGLALYPSPRAGTYGVSVEHGPGIDDEVNPLRAGNFGWAPGAPYDENVPMTDTQRFPGAIKSVWRSEGATIAPSDAAFLRGTQWGRWQGYLAMAVLKGKHLRLLELRDDGTTGEQLRLYDGVYGRLRAATMHTDGSLYLTTDNGSDDQVLKVTPVL